MTFHLGFDTDTFPGAAALDWLKSHTAIAWCGYYLAPAPSHHDTGWMGQREALVADGWGLAPVFLGQQTIGPGSHLVTTGQGNIDGAQAAALSQQEGFPPGSVVYLDWEDGSPPSPDALAYIDAWISALITQGYAPGLYCSHVLADTFVSHLTSGTALRIWAWRVATAGTHPFTGDIRTLAAEDPAGCGYPEATLWQFEQDAVLSLPGTPCDGLEIDLSQSDGADPSALY